MSAISFRRVTDALSVFKAKVAPSRFNFAILLPISPTISFAFEFISLQFCEIAKILSSVICEIPGVNDLVSIINSSFLTIF